MRKVLLLVLAVSLFCGVHAKTTLSLKENAVGQDLPITNVDQAKETVRIASDSSLPSHFTLQPNGIIKLINAQGADYDNPKLRKLNFQVIVKNTASGAGMMSYCANKKSYVCSGATSLYISS